MRCEFKIGFFLVNKWSVYWMGAEITLSHDLGFDGHIRPPPTPVFPKFIAT